MSRLRSYLDALASGYRSGARAQVESRSEVAAMQVVDPRLSHNDLQYNLVIANCALRAIALHVQQYGDDADSSHCDQRCVEELMDLARCALKEQRQL